MMYICICLKAKIVLHSNLFYLCCINMVYATELLYSLAIHSHMTDYATELLYSLAIHSHMTDDATALLFSLAIHSHMTDH